MSETPIDLNALSRNPDLIAQSVPHSAIFGLLRRAVRVPTGWVALITGSEGEVITVPAGGEILSAHAATVLLAREGPQVVLLTDRPVVSSDGYRCLATIQALVELSSDPGDLVAFRKTVLAGVEAATLDTLRTYLQADLLRGLADAASPTLAADLVDGRGADAIEASLRKAIAPACFSSGMRLIGRVNVRFSSPGLEQVRHAADRGAVERDRLAIRAQLQAASAAARQKHLGDVEQMLRQLQETAQHSPDVSLTGLIRTLGQESRGLLYRCLAQSVRSASTVQAIIVAAGSELVWLDPNHPGEPIRRQPVEIPGRAIRSLSCLTDTRGRTFLAIGGSTGIVLMEPADGHVMATLSWPASVAQSVRGGINRVALRGGDILATHSELGLRRWSLEDPGDTCGLLDEMTANRRAVRSVQVDGRNRAWLSIDQNAVCLEGRELAAPDVTVYVGSTSTISSLTVHDDRVFAGNESGEVLSWETDGPDSCTRLCGGGTGPCRSLCVSEVAGVVRLGFTDDSTSVKEAVLDDTVMDQYMAGGERLRQAWWCGNLIVAANDQRNRLFEWRAGEPERPFGTSDVGWICSNRVQDVCFLMALPDPGIACGDPSV
jgi:hypothetical protein